MRAGYSRVYCVHVFGYDVGVYHMSAQIKVPAHHARSLPAVFR